MIVAGGDGDIPDASARVADGQRHFGGVGAEEEIAERDIGGVVGMFRERLLVDRHARRQFEAVDGGYMVSRDDAGAGRLGANGEADDRRVTRRNREAGAAAKKQLAVVAALVIALVQAGKWPDDRERE